MCWGTVSPCATSKPLLVKERGPSSHLETEAQSWQLPCLRTHSCRLRGACSAGRISGPQLMKMPFPELLLEMQAEEPENPSPGSPSTGEDAQDSLLSPVPAEPSAPWLPKPSAMFSTLLLLVLELFVVGGCGSLALPLGLRASGCSSLWQ